MKIPSKRSDAKPSKRSDSCVNARRCGWTAVLSVGLCVSMGRSSMAAELAIDLSAPPSNVSAVTPPPGPTSTSDPLLLSYGPKVDSAATVTNAQVPDAGSPRFSVSIGASAWSGDFGGPSTTTISATLLSATYRLNDLHLSATLPYTRISTAGDIFLGLGATPLIVRAQAAAPSRVNSGIGDLTFSGSYVLHPLSHDELEVELLGALKAPTASTSSHLSTGQADVSFGAELSRPFGRVIPFGSLVYRSFGDSAQYRLRDGPAASVGASYVVTNRLVLNASYDYARSASRFVSDAHELVSGLSYGFAHTGVRISAYASAGLSSGAPAVSGGLSLSKAF